jgi:hypothetical protein
MSLDQGTVARFIPSPARGGGSGWGFELGAPSPLEPPPSSLRYTPASDAFGVEAPASGGGSIDA